ncbi:hypothetical protein [Streptomyces sp. TLI_146]|uniref:hypothetical protein n=1 Tax=Streptomyces sp. TLI_146 TaxID=1938858 RepID=UPI000CB60EF4|nr:hypothetical protein [Streptomyces sp. TLI_146]PKV82614.1 hypothetical protein BX283_0052 [Streptomyces sp. TLI_146]
MSETSESAAREHRPDFPPKSPPPPKKPPSPFPPEPGTQHAPAPLVQGSRARVRLSNRRCVNWPMESALWTASTAQRRIVEQLRAWGYRPDETAVRQVAAVLIAPAVADAGRRISVHLADEGGRACILVLSHQSLHDTTAQLSLTTVADCPSVAACGSDHAPDGTRLWAVVDLTTPKQGKAR